jgi:hypothetical protein
VSGFCPDAGCQRREKRTLFAKRVPVQRILLILRGPIVESALTGSDVDFAADGVEVAICYELSFGRDGLQDGIAAQQALTALLRQRLGARAEAIPIFVACTRVGERIKDYVTAWGATEVRG